MRWKQWCELKFNKNNIIGIYQLYCFLVRGLKMKDLAKFLNTIANQNNKINELPIFKNLIKTVIIPKIKQNKKK